MSQLATDPFVTSDAPSDRRRGEPRVLCDNREISLIAAAETDRARPSRVKLTDCSVHGMGVMLPEAIEAGQQVLVKVDVHRQPMMLMYTVRYCVQTTAEEFRAGLRFSGYLASKFQGDMHSVARTIAGV